MIIPVNDRFVVSASATLVDEGGPLKAWAERHVRPDPDIRWVLGNYVEADEPNNNGHIFPLDELVAAQHTLEGKPLNMLHREHYIVGYFAGAQLLHPSGAEYQPGDEATMAANDGRPYVEALAGLWHHRFKEEYHNIREAHANGTLFFSMESVPQQVSCPGCHHKADFAGLVSDTYCEHMNGACAPKVLHQPVFVGGAIIIPPVRPGWSRADITAISKLIQERPDEAEAAYAAAKEAAPHLEPAQWEAVMAQLMRLAAREFSPGERRRLADQGVAMPDGSYPIRTVQDLRNAIQAFGRAQNKPAVRAHIKRRAKALGRTDLLPASW